MFREELNAQFFLIVIQVPRVMVTGKVPHLPARIGPFCEEPLEACEAFGQELGVLNVLVEHVPYQDQVGDICLEMTQTGQEFSFAPAFRWPVLSAEVHV